jgi:tetratricopeptide (TPR) repeat protein
VVPFRARPELDELLGWCRSQDHAGIRLVTGDGGAGKTRLALQLGEELAANGWQQLWVKRGSEHEAVRAVHEMRRPCVLVVDYAETRSELAALLDDVAADEDGPKLRVVLMARSAGEWWQQLLASAEELTATLLEASALVALGPVHAAGGPQEVFDDAVTAFAQELGVERPDAKLALSDSDPVVLVVHAAALLAVADCAAGVRPQHLTVSGSEVVEALLRHEARYWVRTAASQKLDLDLSVLRLAVAVECLIGAESETGAEALLACIPDLDSAERRGQVARWLHGLYPMPHEDGAQEQDWLGPLRPDRLAEQLVAGELATRPELIELLFTGLSEARAARALTVLARAALTQDRAIDLLRIALAADLDHLAAPALSVAVETNPVIGELLSKVIPGQPVSRETLIAIFNAIPYPTVILASAAVALGQRIIMLLPNDTPPAERAYWFNILGIRFTALGHPTDALRVTQEAVDIYGELAAAHPDLYRPDLGSSLHNLGIAYYELGRPNDAVRVTQEAVVIDRANLARSLVRLCISFSSVGRSAHALAAGQEAVEICRQLAADHPDYRPDLASALHGLGIAYYELDRPNDALPLTQEAVEIYRELAGISPDRYRPHLADSLAHLGICFSALDHPLDALDRPNDALPITQEAVEIRRELAAVSPDRYRPDLARSLGNLGRLYFQLGRPAEALSVTHEAIEILRALTASSLGPPRLGFPRLLNNLKEFSAIVERKIHTTRI